MTLKETDTPQQEQYFPPAQLEPLTLGTECISSPSTKACSKCGVVLPLTEFFLETRSADGKRYSCKVCDKKRTREYRASATKETILARRAYARQKYAKYRKEGRITPRTGPAIQAWRANHRQKNKVARMICHARSRAKKLKLSFDLDAHTEEIKERLDRGICEMTNLPLRRGVGKRTFDTPSIDRIVPSLGYVYSNIRIICHGMNCALGNWGEDKLRLMIHGWK